MDLWTYGLMDLSTYQLITLLLQPNNLHVANWTHFYLCRIEFLGFRFSGWQKQNNVKTVHGMIDKTFEFVFGHTEFKTLGCGRTDAKVSADDYAFELFLKSKMDADDVMQKVNYNLPADIRVKSIEQVDAGFNIIKDVVRKEYHYFFSGGSKTHPFNAPFIRCFEEELDVEKMQEAAALFVGKHHFGNYVVKPSESTVLEREIESACIEPNTKFRDHYTPANSFVFKVRSKGFMRYQVRIMMGAIINVGAGIWTLDDIRKSFVESTPGVKKPVAPSSGLVLHKVEFRSAGG